VRQARATAADLCRVDIHELDVGISHPQGHDHEIVTAFSHRRSLALVGEDLKSLRQAQRIGLAVVSRAKSQLFWSADSISLLFGSIQLSDCSQIEH